MNIGAQIDAETMERVEALLAEVPKGAERAFSNAINRGLSKVKTGASREVKRVYTVQSSALSEATKTVVGKASTGNLAGYVSFAGNRIRLWKFNVTPRKSGTGKMVQVEKQKGHPEAYEDAFIATVTYKGYTGVFERETADRFPIHQRLGPSAAEMIQRTAITEKLQEEAQKTVEERVMHEVERILGRYGG